MKRKILLLCLILIFCTTSLAYAVEAVGSNSGVEIVDPDGSTRLLPLKTYLINDYNYFQLRTLASYMNHTVKKFDVSYNKESNSVVITSNQKYADYDIFDWITSNSGKENASPTKQKIYLDGKEIKLDGYNIKGNNYFKLRDLAACLNFSVDYDASRNMVIINPQKPNELNESFLKKVTVANSSPATDTSVTTTNAEVAPKNYSEKVLGSENYLCYFPAGDAKTINVEPGYIAEIKNCKIVSFKETGKTVTIPKDTAAMYINYMKIKDKPVEIETSDDKYITQDILTKWFKKGLFVPLVSGQKIEGYEPFAIDVEYFTIAKPEQKHDNVLVVAIGDVNQVYDHLYDKNLSYKYMADRAQVYEYAKKGQNTGYIWWLLNIPKNHSDKLEHMINYALSIQGFPYSTYDCSGLVETAAYVAGIDISPAYSWIIEDTGYVEEIPMSQLQRGDLLNKAGSHIMIYIGNGKVVESVPSTGVRVANVRKQGYKALRIIKQDY